MEPNVAKRSWQRPHHAGPIPFEILLAFQPNHQWLIRILFVEFRKHSFKIQPILIAGQKVSIGKLVKEGFMRLIIAFFFAISPNGGPNHIIRSPQFDWV
jgi:hypothetical protein